MWRRRSNVSDEAVFTAHYWLLCASMHMAEIVNTFIPSQKLNVLVLFGLWSVTKIKRCCSPPPLCLVQLNVPRIRLILFFISPSQNYQMLWNNVNRFSGMDCFFFFFIWSWLMFLPHPRIMFHTNPALGGRKLWLAQVQHFLWALPGGLWTGRKTE